MKFFILLQKIERNGNALLLDELVLVGLLVVVVVEVVVLPLAVEVQEELLLLVLLSQPRGVVLIVIVQEELDVALPIPVLEVQNEGNRQDIEGNAHVAVHVPLQALDQPDLGSDLLVEFKDVHHLLQVDTVSVHLLVMKPFRMLLPFEVNDQSA